MQLHEWKAPTLLLVCLFVFAYLFHMFSLVNIDIMIVNGILLSWNIIVFLAYGWEKENK